MKSAYLFMLIGVLVFNQNSIAQGLPKTFSVGQEVEIKFCSNLTTEDIAWKIEEIDGSWIRLSRPNMMNTKERVDEGWFYTGNFATIKVK